MAKWVTSAVLDDGLNVIKANAIRMLIISAYSAADSYATVVSNMVAEAVVASGDFTLSNESTGRKLVSATKQAAATASALGTPDLHIAFTNNVDTVYWVTDETTNQPITSGNLVNFPACTLTAVQPT